MKRIILGGVAAAAIVLGIAGAALAATTNGGRAPASSPASSVAPAGRRLPVAYNGIEGWRDGAVRPAVIYIGESDVFVRSLHWSHWTASSATAHGTLWVDTCTPTCSAGHYHRYAAVVTLGRAAAHQGVRYFSRMSLSYRHTYQRHYTFRWGILPGATIPGWNGGPTR